MEVIADGGQAPEHGGQAAGAGQDAKQEPHIPVSPAQAHRGAPLHVGGRLAFTELLLDHPELDREAVRHGQHQVTEVEDTVEAGQGDAEHGNVLNAAHHYRLTGSSDHKPSKGQLDVLHKHSDTLVSVQSP